MCDGAPGTGLAAGRYDGGEHVSVTGRWTGVGWVVADERDCKSSTRSGSPPQKLILFGGGFRATPTAVCQWQLSQPEEPAFRAMIHRHSLLRFGFWSVREAHPGPALHSPEVHASSDTSSFMLKTIGQRAEFRGVAPARFLALAGPCVSSALLGGRRWGGAGRQGPGPLILRHNDILGAPHTHPSGPSNSPSSRHSCLKMVLTCIRGCKDRSSHTAPKINDDGVHRGTMPLPRHVPGSSC